MRSRLALRAVVPGGAFRVAAPNHQGGTRLRKEMQAFGCTAEETARRHHRIVVCARPDNPKGVDEALANGGPRIVEGLGVWSQPGVFSWDRVDPGSALLLDHLPALERARRGFWLRRWHSVPRRPGVREGRADDADRYRPAGNRMRAAQYRRRARRLPLGGCAAMASPSWPSWILSS